MNSQRMDVAGAPCIVSRITFTGSLGFEIWMEPSFQRKVYKEIKSAGEEYGIVDFGTRALSMRLEKTSQPGDMNYGQSTVHMNVH